MNDADFDKLLELARRTKPSVDRDPRWERRAAGLLSPEEEAQLCREVEATEEGRRMLKHFAPPAPERERRAAEEVLRGQSPRPESDLTEPAAVTPIDRRPNRPKRLLTFLIAPAFAASAAAAAIPMVWPLPAYQVEWRQAPAAVLGDPAEGSRLVDPWHGGEVILWLLPDTSVWRPMGARVFAGSKDHLMLLAAGVKAEGEGAATVSFDAAALSAWAPGNTDIWIFTGSSMLLPDDADSAQRLIDSPRRAVRLVRTPVRLAGR